MNKHKTINASEYINKLIKLHAEYEGDLNDEYWRKAAELNKEYKKG